MIALWLVLTQPGNHDAALTLSRDDLRWVIVSLLGLGVTLGGMVWRASAILSELRTANTTVQKGLAAHIAEDARNFETLREEMRHAHVETRRIIIEAKRIVLAARKTRAEHRATMDELLRLGAGRRRAGSPRVPPEEPMDEPEETP